MTQLSNSFFAAADNLNAVSQMRYQKLVAEERLWTTLRASEAENSVVDFMVKNQDMGPGFTDAAQQHVTDLEKKALEIAPSKRVKDDLTERFAAMRLQYGAKAMQAEARVVSQQKEANIREGLQNSMDLLAKRDGDPDVLVREQETATLNLVALRDAKVIDIPTYETLKRSVANLAVVAAEARISKSPDEAESIIRNAPGVDWDRRDSVLQRIERARETHSTLAANEARRALDTAGAQMRANGTLPTGFTPELYASQFPKAQQADRAIEAKIVLDDSKTMFSIQRELQGASPKQMQAVREKYSQKNIGFSGDHERIENQVEEQIQRQEVAIRRDPYSYAMQDPVLQDIAAKAEAIPEQTPGKEDEMRRLIQLNVDYQRDVLGVAQPKVMPAALVPAVVQQINNGKPSEVKGAFVMLERKYGKFFPEAIKQLIDAEQGMKPAMQIVALHINKPWADELIAAIQADPKSFKIESEDDVKKIESYFGPGGNPSVTAFFESMVLANPRLADLTSAYGDAFTTWAKYLVSSGRQTAGNVGNAVVERGILSEYAFGEVNGKPIIIRKNGTHVRGPHSWDPQSLDTIMESYKDMLTSSYIIDQVDLKSLVGNEQVGLQRIGAARILANNAFWALNRTQDGLVLYAPSISDKYGETSIPQPILRPDGKPITVSFTQAYLEGRNPSVPVPRAPVRPEPKAPDKVAPRFNANPGLYSGGRFQP